MQMTREMLLHKEQGVESNLKIMGISEIVTITGIKIL